MDDLAKPKNEWNLLSKLPFVLFGLGMLLVVVGNVLSVRGNGPYVDNGIGVRSVGFVVAISGMVWFLVSQFASRMAKREGADLVKNAPRRGASTGYRPLPVYLEYDLHIAFCFVAMAVSIVCGLCSIPMVLQSFSMGRFFTPFTIFRTFSYLLFQFVVAYLFWLVSRILKRMQQVELERQRADLEFMKSSSSATQAAAQSPTQSNAADLDDVFGGNQ